jgi:uncharacterized membrane protein
MMTQHTDVVSEYLREVDLRLAGLPVLQRRELLADLAAHIANERAERNIQTEGELIEVLERLGSPEVVAAAAHEEFGPPPVAGPPPLPSRGRARWVWPVVAGVSGLFVLFVLVLCVGGFFLARSSGPEPGKAPAAVPAATATAAPTPTPTRSS